jgi:GNAT superfamily N-acetyltransferase
MDNFDEARQAPISIRLMLPGDVAAGMRLKALAGWNQTERDWRMFLAANPGGCYVATHRERVIGTAASIVYSGSLAWIGMVLVDPAYRRQGVATRLVQRAMAALKGVPTIKLDATALGKTLYERLGFRDAAGLGRLTAERAAIPGEATGLASPLTENDLPRLAALDRAAFGADRLGLIAALIRANPDTAWKIERNRTIDGYCAGRPGSRYYQLGPLVAATPSDAIDLATAALGVLSGQPVVIDVPLHQAAFLAWLPGLGFTKQRSFVRMVYGPDPGPGLPETVFAVAGPEFG